LVVCVCGKSFPIWLVWSCLNQVTKLEWLNWTDEIATTITTSTYYLIFVFFLYILYTCTAKSGQDEEVCPCFFGAFHCLGYSYRSTQLESTETRILCI
jgi:hypothetical protein